MRFPERKGLKPAVTTGADPERWVEEHGDCLYRFALLRVRRPEIAEDLVQETFLVAVKTAGNFRGKSSERSWLCGILKNKICDYFRKLGRETCFTDLEFLNDELTRSIYGNCASLPCRFQIIPMHFRRIPFPLEPRNE